MIGRAGLMAGFGLAAAAALPAAGCNATASHLQPASPVARWTDTPVSFDADGLTTYATYRHQLGGRGQKTPAALLIAGSGPTDRDGNSPLIAHAPSTLRVLADLLSADGVASLRYDKLGSGRTGLGRHANKPGAIGLGAFAVEAAAALRFLARQPGVDRARLGVFTHSAGSMLGLLLGAGLAGPVPSIHALVLLEPLSRRPLDLLLAQVTTQLDRRERAGAIGAAQAARVRSEVSALASSLRATGRVPPDLAVAPGKALPTAVRLLPGLAAFFSPVNARFQSEQDRYDPARLARRLPAGLPVLIACGEVDAKVSCGDVDRLAANLRQASAKVVLVRLRGVDHDLRESGGGALSLPPFSRALARALHAFVAVDL